MNTRQRLIALVCLGLGSAAANATGVSVDFSSVVTDIGTVSTAVIGLLVAFKGAQYVWKAVRKG